MSSVEVAFVAGIGIPILGFLITISVQWGGLRSDLRSINKDLIEIVKDKDDMQHSILDQMKVDREATDRRLRWLEENVWRNRGSSKDHTQ
jgi:hypothetical protein